MTELENKIIEEMKLQIKELEKEIQRLKTIHMDGWQGKDKLEIGKEGDEWIIIEHRKDKETKEISSNTHKIPESNVFDIWELIKTKIGERETTSSRKIALDLITKKRIPVGLDEFWGGKNRSKYLFPLLYYPLKILEAKGFIKYGGRGRIVRLR